MSKDQAPKEQSAEWFETVLNTIPDQILVKGPKSHLRWANKAFCDYYGMSVAELNDIIDSPVSDPDDTVQYVRDDHQVFSSGETLNIRSEPVTNSQGEVNYFNTVKSALRSPTGEVIGTVGIGRLVEDADLVARSEANRAASKATISELRALVAGIPTAVAMLDIELRFMARSAEWLKIFPSNPSSNSNREFERYDQEHENLLPLEADLQSTINTGKPTNRSASAIESQTISQYVDTRVQAWHLASGEVGGVIIVLNDITSRIAAEQRLRAANDELLQLNYRTSHDLVSPLRTIRGLISVAEAEMKKGQLDKLDDIHQRIKKSAETLSSLVMNILKLSQSYGDEQNSEIEISHLVKHAAKRHSADLEAAGIQVRMDLPSTLIHGEPTRFMQIVDNLIGNAVKYYDPQQPEPFVELTVKETSGHVILLVTDNGLGIDSNMTEKIFDIFQRGSADLPGSGLGLYLARKHAIHMGGNLRVLNNKDNTIMQLTLNKPD